MHLPWPWQVALRWADEDVFWPRGDPYLQVTDPRFRCINGDYFGKRGLLVVLVAPPYADTLESLTDSAVLEELLPLLHAAFAPSRPPPPPPLEVRITRWGSDPFSFGSYSYDRVGSTLAHRTNLRAAEAVDLPTGDAELPRLFFAGEACSADAPQCVHGAVETGYQAAAEALRVLTMATCAEETAISDARATGMVQVRQHCSRTQSATLTAQAEVNSHVYRCVSAAQFTTLARRCLHAAAVIAGSTWSASVLLTQWQM